MHHPLPILHRLPVGIAHHHNPHRRSGPLIVLSPSQMTNARQTRQPRHKNCNDHPITNSKSHSTLDPVGFYFCNLTSDLSLIAASAPPEPYPADSYHPASSLFLAPHTSSTALSAASTAP